ncbi:energy transducer TonB [Flavobacterium sp. N1736]|uniref:energy transducer TonB n=1 Tax=Flavobacterium sp. N1736 TaxID=2986823 RepID=UPI0022249829|nr:energy transducer TonB [Flavobacterium sp. N1736]
MKKIITLAFLILATFSYSQTENVIGSAEPMQAEKEDLKIYDRKEVEVPAGFQNYNIKINQFISENFVVSKKIKEKKISGDIVLSFVVEKDGSFTAVKIIKDLGYDTGKELERVIKLQKWLPAELNGKKVRSTFNLTYTINQQ